MDKVHEKLAAIHKMVEEINTKLYVTKSLREKLDSLVSDVVIEVTGEGK